ncbi:MAG: crossover junction endodeoxyribonuclease RuvC [Alphaproteobacteria bacterium]
MSQPLNAHIILGLDPGLRHCGWGVISMMGNRLRYVANGRISPPTTRTIGQRLAILESGLVDLLDRHNINTVAVEQTFQNTNPQATLALGMARGICLMVPAKYGLETTDYAPNTVKKSLVGKGHADKSQVEMMVKRLLVGVKAEASDEFDALAIAICHAHHWQFNSVTGQ